MLLKIGELAQRSGLTVRTLHHYDSIGLLRASGRSEAGYRLYDRGDLSRLYRIQALRKLELSLDEIAHVLSGRQADVQSVIAQQIAGLERQIQQASALRDRLQHLVTRFASELEPSAEEWLNTLELMTTYSKYFSDEEISAWQNRSQSAPEQAAQWPELVQAVRGLMDSQIPPQAAEAQALAWRWARLVQQTMGNDPRFFKKLQAMHRNEPGVQAHTGIDGALVDYITQAVLEAKFSLYAKYFNQAEMERARRGHQRHLGDWGNLVAEVRDVQLQGLAPGDTAVQALLQRWNSLFLACWGESEDLRQRVRAAHAADPDLLLGSGIDDEMMQFIRSGFEHMALQGKQHG